MLIEVILHLEIRRTVLLIITAVLLPRQEAAIRAEAVVPDLLIAAVAAVAVPVHRIAVVEAEVRIHPEAVVAVVVAVEDKHEQQKLKL